MKKIIYTGLLISSYLLGSYQHNLKKFETKEINHNWYLINNKNKIPIYQTYSNPQLGNIEYRLRGLLEENNGELERTIELIKKDKLNTKK